ncbi:unnamed protein product, partial [Effrenium voratum]
GLRAGLGEAKRGVLRGPGRAAGPAGAVAPGPGRSALRVRAPQHHGGALSARRPLRAAPRRPAEGPAADGGVLPEPRLGAGARRLPTSAPAGGGGETRGEGKAPGGLGGR